MQSLGPTANPPREWLPPVLSAAAMVLAFVVLRIPDLRNSLLGLVEHRPPVSEWGLARQFAAARSCLIAGLVGFTCAAIICLLTRASHPSQSARYSALLGLPLSLSMFVWLQILVVVAVVLNLILAQRMVHGGWPGQIPPDRILHRIIGPMAIEAAAVRDEIGPSPAVYYAPVVPGSSDDRYLFSALVYPAQLFAGPEVWQSAAEQRGLVRLLTLKRRAHCTIARDPELGVWFPATAPHVLPCSGEIPRIGNRTETFR